MKKLFRKYGALLASLSLAVTAINVNSACIFFAHQPELPKGAMKLRSF
jgi:cyclic lactone autoinducer peptide